MQENRPSSVLGVCLYGQMKGMIQGGNHLAILKGLKEVKKVDIFISMDLIDESVAMKDGCSRNRTPTPEFNELVSSLHPANQTIVHFNMSENVMNKLSHMSNCISMMNYEAKVNSNAKEYSHILFIRPEAHLESMLPPNVVWEAMSKTAGFAVIPSYFAPHHSCPNLQVFSLGYLLAQAYVKVTPRDVDVATGRCLKYGRQWITFPNVIHKRNQTCDVPECKIESLGFNISGLWSPWPFHIQWSMKRNFQVGVCPPGSEDNVKSVWKRQGSQVLEG